MHKNNNCKIKLYWKDNKSNSFDSHFPVPIENSWKDNEEKKHKIICAIKHLYNNPYRNEGYLGDSYCRICNKTNGNFESTVQFGKYIFIIPQGYIHYIEDHNVEPNKQLLECIEGIINFDIKNPFHIFDVLEEHNYNISKQDLYKQIVEHYKNFNAIFGYMRHIDKVAFKERRNGFKNIDYFTVGNMIK